MTQPDTRSDEAVPEVTQADIDAAEVWRRQWQHCAGERTKLVEAFAAHRTRAQVELLEALEDCAEWLVGDVVEDVPLATDMRAKVLAAITKARGGRP